jgi:hypothetical protein
VRDVAITQFISGPKGWSGVIRHIGSLKPGQVLWSAIGGRTFGKTRREARLEARQIAGLEAA